MDGWIDRQTDTQIDLLLALFLWRTLANTQLLMHVHQPKTLKEGFVETNKKYSGVRFIYFSKGERQQGQIFGHPQAGRFPV